MSGGQPRVFRQEPVDVIGMRARNRTMMLQLLWSERTLSRADLARRTGMSRSSVSSIVSDLLDAHLVEESGSGESSGGRRPIILRFRDDACVIAGVDMGATHVACALTDLRGEVLAWRHAPHAVRIDPRGTLELVEQQVRGCLEEAGAPAGRLAGVGVAVPSPVDPRQPGRLAPTILPDWAQLDVVQRLKDIFDVPIFVENDANLGAVAEQWWGAGHGIDNLAFIKLGSGIGAGHIINGSLYRGSHGIAGEIGHVATTPGGAQCNCGLRGCLYANIGWEGLREQMKTRASSFPWSRLASKPPTMDLLIEGAREGDPLAEAVIQEAGRHLGIAIVSMLNLLDPGVIVVGGRLAEVGDQLLGPVRTLVRKRMLWTQVSETRIVASTLGRRCVALGAASHVLSELLQAPDLFPAPRALAVH